jgi:hypothetical protein
MKRFVIVGLIGSILFLTGCAQATEIPKPTASFTPPPTQPPTPTVVPPTATLLPPTPSPTDVPPSLAEISAEIVKGVGEVKGTFEGEPHQVVYVFAENHASIGGQLEINSMLIRLYSQQGMRHIGLEGWAADAPPLDLSWAHRSPQYRPGDEISPREDVLVFMVKDGELNSAEFLGLIYNDVLVHGIDDAKLYQVPNYSELWNTTYDHVYQIAISMLSAADFEHWKALIETVEFQQAYDFAIGTNEYAQGLIERIKGKNSAEDFILLLDELEAENQKWADHYGNPIPNKMIQQMAALRLYMAVVMQRSDALAANTLAMLADNPGAPVAITVGLMHADRILELFEAENVSYVYVWPHTLTLDEDPTIMSPEGYARKQAGESPGEEGTIGALLSGSKKPPPVAEQPRIEEEQQVREVFQRAMDAIFLAAIEKLGKEFTDGKIDLISKETGAELINAALDRPDSAALKDVITHFKNEVNTTIEINAVHIQKSENGGNLVALGVLFVSSDGSPHQFNVIRALDGKSLSVEKSYIDMDSDDGFHQDRDEILEANAEARWRAEEREAANAADWRANYWQACSNTWYRLMTEK